MTAVQPFNPSTGEITNPTPVPQPIAQIQTADVIQIHEWAAELNAAHQLGVALANSNFLPNGLRMKGKNSYKTIDELSADAAAVILAGKSVGLDPMQSVQNIFPVHGMPSMYARTMSALVISKGHELVRSEATEQSVTVQARRKGGDRWQAFTWTIQRATKAGYTANSKYKSDPIGMLTAKALAEACRLVFPDVLLGMPYSVEDLELDPDMNESAQVPEKPKTKVTRRPRKSQVPDPVKPPVVEDAPVEVEPEAGEPAGGNEVWEKVVGFMCDVGLTIPDDSEDEDAAWLQVANTLTENTWESIDDIDRDAGNTIWNALQA